MDSSQIDFEKRLKQLPHRSKKRKVNVLIRKYTYELEVYEQTTLNQIIQRYKDNGYFPQVSNVVLWLDGKEQTELDKTIKIIMNRDEKKVINIQLMDEIEIKKNKVKRTIIMNQQSANKSVSYQSMHQTNSITTHEFKQLIQLVESKKTSDKKYRQFYTVLADRFKNYMSITKVNSIFEEFLKDSINVGQVLKIIGGGELVEPLVNKVKDIALRIMSIELNHAFFQKILRKLSDVSPSKSPQKLRKSQLDRKYGSNQKQILQNIDRIISELEQQKLKWKSSEQKIIQFKENNQQLEKKNHELNLLNEYLGKLYEKDSGQTWKKVIKVSTNYLNKADFREDVEQIISTIEKHQKREVCQFESLLSIRSGTAKVEVIATLLDMTAFVGEHARVMMLIGLANKMQLMVYSKGMIRNIKKQVSKSNNIKSDESQFAFGEQQSCRGFIMQTKTKKKYVSTSDGPLISYGNHFVNISSCFRMLYGIRNRLLLQVRQNRNGELEDDEQQLQKIFGSKVKEMEVIDIEVFNVKLNEEAILHGISTILYKCQEKNSMLIDVTKDSLYDISIRTFIHEREKC